MDLYAVSEESYKNGYAKGYADAMKECREFFTGSPKSGDTGKWNAMKAELYNWGYDDWYSDTVDAVRTITNEMSWRLVVRVVHKLRRKRGAES